MPCEIERLMLPPRFALLSCEDTCKTEISELDSLPGRSVILEMWPSLKCLAASSYRSFSFYWLVVLLLSLFSYLSTDPTCDGFCTADSGNKLSSEEGEPSCMFKCLPFGNFLSSSSDSVSGWWNCSPVHIVPNPIKAFAARSPKESFRPFLASSD